MFKKFFRTLGLRVWRISVSNAPALDDVCQNTSYSVPFVFLGLYSNAEVPNLFKIIIVQEYGTDGCVFFGGFLRGVCMQRFRSA